MVLPRLRSALHPNQRDLVGPLAYGPAVPELADGDTVVVKMDAKHKIYQIASGVLYQAWTFGDSIPGLDKVWLDGNPQNELVGMQSVTLGPGSGAIVEFVMPEKGMYHFVDHSFANAEMGAVGNIKAE